MDSAFWQGPFLRAVRHVVALTAPVPFVALRHFPTPWGITTVLKEIISYLTEYSKTPKPSRFSGFYFCLKIYLGANYFMQPIIPSIETLEKFFALLYHINITILNPCR